MYGYIYIRTTFTLVGGVIVVDDDGVLSLVTRARVPTNAFYSANKYFVYGQENTHEGPVRRRSVRVPHVSDVTLIVISITIAIIFTIFAQV